MGGSYDSAVRIYEIGRKRSNWMDDSDGEEEGEDQDDDGDEDSGLLSELSVSTLS